MGGGKYTAMRKGLDSINTLNRNDQPFTSAGVQPYVDYFDDHGTSNEQVLAHYLLGRAYHEHGEAPMALKCYQEATERADTTATDCDYKQLSRVYGQMADIFYYQGLYRQELVYDKFAEKYAWKGDDTLTALMCHEQQSFAYKRLGLIDSAIYIVEEVANHYKEYGYPSDAAIALGTIVRDLVEKGEYSKARSFMHHYESESGLFDIEGNIQKGREIYYYTKGKLYLTRNMLDSAEYWFRKELQDGKDFNNQNAGAYGLAEGLRKRIDGNALAVEQVKFSLLERRCYFVLYYLAPCSVSYDLRAVLYLLAPSYLNSYRCVEFERSSARGSLGVAVHNADLFSYLVDKYRNAV